MKSIFCPQCGEKSPDTASFCWQCGTRLPQNAAAHPEYAPSPAPALEAQIEAAASSSRHIDPTALHQAAKFQLGIENGPLPPRKADVLFVVDCTASMYGELQAIKEAITSFATMIKEDGIQVRVGMISFRDRFCGEEAEPLYFDGEPFTDDSVRFAKAVDALHADGGGDIPESSLDALLMALRQPFTPGADKVLVLVTDAPPHVPDKEARSVEEVSQLIKAAGVRQLYLVIRCQEAHSQVYLKLLEGTRGLAFNLGRGSDFRDRSESFVRTLGSLGRSISRATT